MNILNVGYDSTNYYLLEPDGAGLLVDVGWPGTLPRLLNVLKRRGLAFRQIKYLLCTHYHPDHAGLAQELKDQGVRLLVLDTQLAALAALGAYMKPAHHFHAIRPEGNLNLNAGGSRSFLRSVGLNGEIIYTPGHSDDCVTLILDGGLAFTGDALSPTQAGTSPGQVGNIWAALRSRAVSTIYPGHGPAFQPGS